MIYIVNNKSSPAKEGGRDIRFGISANGKPLNDVLPKAKCGFSPSTGFAQQTGAQLLAAVKRRSAEREKTQCGNKLNEIFLTFFKEKSTKKKTAKECNGKRRDR